jgi:hypothetical protein
MGSWEDKDLAENVAADFDEIDYLSNVISLTPHKKDTVRYVSAQEAGADSGAVLFVAKGGWDKVKFSFAKPINFSADKTLYIRMKTSSTALAQMSLIFYDKDGNMLNNQPTNPHFNGSATVERLSANNNAYTRNEWFNLYLQGDMLVSAFGTGDVYAIELNTNNTTGGIYFDEIGFDTNPFVVDETIEENVVADFDELAYTKKTSLGTYTVYQAFAKFVPSGIEGANGGVIQFVSIGNTECHLGLTKAIDLSKVKSIEIRIKVEKTAEKLNLGAIDANGKKSSANITTYKTDVVTGEWMTVSLDVAKLTPVFGAEGVLNTIYLYTPSSCGNVYADYISVTPNA